jgi:hypothetical protein
LFPEQDTPLHRPPDPHMLGLHCTGICLLPVCHWIVQGPGGAVQWQLNLPLPFGQVFPLGAVVASLFFPLSLRWEPPPPHLMAVQPLHGPASASPPDSYLVTVTPISWQWPPGWVKLPHKADRSRPIMTTLYPGTLSPACFCWWELLGL